MSSPKPMIISVPQPDAKFNSDRKINTLLQYQVRHLLDIEHKHLIPSHRTGSTINPASMTERELTEHLKTWTEGQAAQYIKLMTKKLHELRSEPGMTPERVAKRNPRSAAKSKAKVSASGRSPGKSKVNRSPRSKVGLKPKAKHKSKNRSN